MRDVDWKIVSIVSVVPRRGLGASVLVAGYLRRDRPAVSRVGTEGLAIVVDQSAKRKGLKPITEGSDFDFKSACLLEASFKLDEHVHTSQNDYLEGE